MAQFTYDSIDGLITYFEPQVANYTSTSVYEYLIWKQSHMILETLRSKTNGPSVHDLFLIRVINNKPRSKFAHDYAQWKDVTRNILQEYRDRKVIQ